MQRRRLAGLDVGRLADAHDLQVVDLAAGVADRQLHVAGRQRQVALDGELVEPDGAVDGAGAATGGSVLRSVEGHHDGGHGQEQADQREEADQQRQADAAVGPFLRLRSAPAPPRRRGRRPPPSRQPWRPSPVVWPACRTSRCRDGTSRPRCERHHFGVEGPHGSSGCAAGPPPEPGRRPGSPRWSNRAGRRCGRHRGDPRRGGRLLPRPRAVRSTSTGCPGRRTVRAIGRRPVRSQTGDGLRQLLFQVDRRLETGALEQAGAVDQHHPGGERTGQGKGPGRGANRLRRPVDADGDDRGKDRGHGVGRHRR